MIGEPSVVQNLRCDTSSVSENGTVNCRRTVRLAGHQVLQTVYVADGVATHVRHEATFTSPASLAALYLPDPRAIQSTIVVDRMPEQAAASFILDQIAGLHKLGWDVTDGMLPDAMPGEQFYKSLSAGEFVTHTFFNSQGHLRRISTVNASCPVDRYKPLGAHYPCTRVVFYSLDTEAFDASTIVRNDPSLEGL